MKTLTNPQKQCLDIIIANGSIASYDVARKRSTWDVIGRYVTQTKRIIQRLESRGLVECVGWDKWKATDKGREALSA